MNPRLSPIRTAFLKLIMASYGPWYLLRLPSGDWHTCWYFDAHDEQAMESYLIDEDGMEESRCFSTRRAALKEILKSLDREIEDAGVGYIAARQRVRDSLLSITNEQDPLTEQNDFSGTPDETALIEDWIRSDRRESHEKLASAKQRAVYMAACAE